MKKEEAKRDPVQYRYDILDPDFEELMARIAHYGAEHYGDNNWKKSRLIGGKSPMNHIRKHYTSYMGETPYDHKEIGDHHSIHLVAIAFNAMMEFYHVKQRIKS